MAGIYKYEVKHDFFKEINNEENAYFLGLLYADGYNYEKNKTFSISLQEEDKEILDKFKDIICPEKPLYYKKTKGKNQYTLSITSKQISEDLARLGCIQAKTQKLQFPEYEIVPPNLTHHFIRGYFDGDGCITYNKERSRYKVNILGTENMCDTIRFFFTEGLNLSNVSVLKLNNVYSLNYCSKSDIIQIREFFYLNSNLFLKRKHTKFYEI
jgi:hypothetical protein